MWIFGGQGEPDNFEAGPKGFVWPGVRVAEKSGCPVTIRSARTVPWSCCFWRSPASTKQVIVWERRKHKEQERRRLTKGGQSNPLAAPLASRIGIQGQ